MDEEAYDTKQNNFEGSISLILNADCGSDCMGV